MKKLKLYIIVFFCLVLTLEAHSKAFQETKIIATHYTGPTWAPSFWSNININRVYQDLSDIRENGFNTVILIIPWVGFQVSVKPIEYSEAYFSLLENICKMINKMNLNLIVRVGYTHEIGNESIPGHYERMINLFSDNNLLHAWTEYLEQIYKVVRHGNFLFGFLTWEDFYLLGLTHGSEELRLILSQKSGFQHFLNKYSLSELSKAYGEDFKSFHNIPIPGTTSPAVYLFNEFWDQYLIDLFKLSKKYFKKLGMGVRVDCEPSNTEKQYICHEKTFDLGGEGGMTLIYYHPAWGALNISDQSTAKETISRFQYLLQKVKEHTDNKIFIDQFNFVDNTPGFETNTRIIPDHVPAFIDKAADIIHKNTIGYGLWSMKDIKGNLIQNGSFERGLQGWEVKNGKLIEDKSQKESRMKLFSTGELLQKLNFTSVSSPEKKALDINFTLSFIAKKIGVQPGKLFVRIKNKDGQKIYQCTKELSKQNFTYYHLDDLPIFGDGVMHIVNLGGEIVMDQIELYFCIQKNGIYSVDGTPRSFRDNVISLNSRLLKNSSAAEFYNSKNMYEYEYELKGLFHDRWVGQILSGKIMLPDIEGDSLTFVMEAYIPEAWKSYTNKVTGKLDNKIIGSGILKPGYNKIIFKLPKDRKNFSTLPFSLKSDRVYQPSIFDTESSDQRKLSFVLISLGIPE